MAIARIAEDAGVQALTVHGRTRACAFVGAVEYDTIAAVKRAVTIPVIANGDIATPEAAKAVLAHTGADALMIGRAAQGRPWIFREIAHFLATGVHLPPPTVAEARALIVAHLADHYAFYGEVTGVRTARKHLGWYTEALAGGEALPPRDVRGADDGRAARVVSRLLRRAGERIRAPAVSRRGRAPRRQRSGDRTTAIAVGRGGPRSVTSENSA